jgi:O-antigen/teichoic acid export membrane protein
MAWLLALAIWIASAPMATFYDQPLVREVMRLLAVNFLIVPFTSMTISCLRRRLQVGAICLINTSHSLAQLAATLWLAARGHGTLSLAWGTVAAAVAALLVSMALRPAEVPWLPSLKGARHVFRFGFYATGGNLVDEFGVAAPDLVIGKAIGPEAVALFGKAQALLNLFSQAVTSAVSPVLLPLFAAQARAGADLRDSYLLTVASLTALAWPFFASLALLAVPVLQLLYGGQWDGATPLIRIMCCSAALYSMFSMSRYLFIATGHVREQARLDTLTVAIRVALLVPAALLGLHWAAYAVVAGMICRGCLTWKLLVRIAGLDAASLSRAVAASAAVTAVTMLAPLAAVLAVAPGPAQLAVAVGGAIPMWLAAVVLVRHPLAAELQLAWRKVRQRDAV